MTTHCFKHLFKKCKFTKRFLLLLTSILLFNTIAFPISKMLLKEKQSTKESNQFLITNIIDTVLISIILIFGLFSVFKENPFTVNMFLILLSTIWLIKWKFNFFPVEDEKLIEGWSQIVEIILMGIHFITILVALIYSYQVHRGNKIDSLLNDSYY